MSNPYVVYDMAMPMAAGGVPMPMMAEVMQMAYDEETEDGGHDYDYYANMADPDGNMPDTGPPPGFIGLDGEVVVPLESPDDANSNI